MQWTASSSSSGLSVTPSHSRPTSRVNSKSPGESSTTLQDEIADAVSRHSGACVQCKSFKVKCHFIPGQDECRRCQTRGDECAIRARKRRKAAPTHEELEDKSNSQDAQIQQILRQLDDLKKEEKFSTWISGNSRYVPANYPDMATPTTSRFRHGHNLPDILCTNLLRPQDIEELFYIFFKQINPLFSVLDPVLHTSDRLISTSPFLFTVVCAVASRFQKFNSELYPVAAEFARNAAKTTLVFDQLNNVESCQAYLLLTMHPLPANNANEDRSLLMMSLAIRVALNLGLNDSVPPLGCDERGALNRQRTWSLCLFLDAMYTKKSVISHNRITKMDCDWCKFSTLTLPSDVGLCEIIEICAVMEDFWSTVGNGDEYWQQRLAQQGLEINTVIISYDQMLVNVIRSWEDRSGRDPTIANGTSGSYTRQLTALFMRMVVLSFGLSEEVEISWDGYMFQQLLNTARMATALVIDHMYPAGVLKYSIEANFVCATFAAKILTEPKFLLSTEEPNQSTRVMRVRQLTDIMCSKEVNVDKHHAPGLYSKYLASLLTDLNSVVPPYHDLGGEQPNACMWMSRSSRLLLECDGT